MLYYLKHAKNAIEMQKKKICEGDSQHTQNIQINKVTGENEKCVFYFMEQT